MMPSDYQARRNLLEGRVILVTGASGGLGRMAAQAYARHGATVILHGRNTERLEQVYDEIASSGCPEPMIVPLDLASASDRDFEHMAQAIGAQLERLDGILHSASHFTHLTSLEHERLDEWMRSLRVNVAAVFALTRACTPLLRAAPDASVLLTGETHGEKPGAFWGGFAVSKHALGAYNAIQAQEWDDAPNLRINLLIPGKVNSPHRARTHPGEAARARTSADLLLPLYLYLMGPDSRGISGRVFAPEQDGSVPA